MNVLVLSGGGIFGALHLGALHSRGVVKYRVIAGTSIGAIIGALVAVGYTPLELLRAIPDTLISPDLQVAGFGMASQEPLVCFIETLLKAKCQGRSLTFLELYTRFDVDLVVTGTCLDTQRSERFHRHAYPNMRLIDALRISCCVPLLFPQILYENKTYVDGCVSDNFPLAFARTYIDTYFPKETDTVVHAQNIVHCAAEPPDTSTLHGYIQTLFKIFIDSKAYDYGDVPVLELVPSKTNVNMMKYTQRDMDRLFNDGYEIHLKNAVPVE